MGGKGKKWEKRCTLNFFLLIINEYSFFFSIGGVWREKVKRGKGREREREKEREREREGQRERERG